MIIKNKLFNGIPFKQKLGKVLCKHYLESPVFIVGSGRSGTTAINECINQHEHIKGSRNEVPLALHLLEMLYQSSDGPVNDWYQKSVSFELDELVGRTQQLLYESVWGDYWGLRQTLGVFQGGFTANMNYRHWSAKIFPKEHQVKSLQDLFNDTRFIYVIRNGAEVVHSMSKFGEFKHKSFKQRCEFWVETNEKYNYLQQHKSAITIRHEDFVNKPREEINRICDHIGISFDNAMLNQATSVLTHSLDKNTDQVTDVKTVLQNRQSPYEAWPQNQKETFDEICSYWMKRLSFKY